MHRLLRRSQTFMIMPFEKQHTAYNNILHANINTETWFELGVLDTSRHDIAHGTCAGISILQPQRRTLFMYQNNTITAVVEKRNYDTPIRCFLVPTGLLSYFDIPLVTFLPLKGKRIVRLSNLLISTLTSLAIALQNTPTNTYASAAIKFLSN